MNPWTRLLTVTAAIVIAPAASAATVTFHVGFPDSNHPNDSIGRPPIDQLPLPDPATAGKRVHTFFVTTDADILRVGDVFLEGVTGIYQHQVGSNSEPPNPIFFAIFPSLADDTWINTPGITAIAGNTTDPFGTPNNSWFDTSNDGPVTQFQFAQITADVGPRGVFRGVVSVVDASGDPEVFPFSFGINPIPEPTAACLAGMSLFGLAALRRRLPG
jgi:hypothetical protein